MRVPSERDFTNQATDYLAADDLDALAETIIAARPGLDWLSDVTIAYFWKRRGGRQGGKANAGSCRRCDKLQRHLLAADLVVWLAADHCRGQCFDARQIEALLHHQLRHVGRDGKGRPSVRGHDAEFFLSDIQEYGAWSRDLQGVVGLVEQLWLPRPA